MFAKQTLKKLSIFLPTFFYLSSSVHSLAMISNIVSLENQHVWSTSDPFLFCVHHEDNYPKGNKNQGIDRQFLKGRNIGSDFTVKDGYRMYHGDEVPGFPSHPHRGFETITIVSKGLIDHSDSLGCAARFGDGDVQWVTSGKGIQHSEMFPLISETDNNYLDFFQIWINLPKANKMVDPYFSMFWAENVPKISKNNCLVTVVAGAFDGVAAPNPPPSSWASRPESNVGILTVTMQSDGRLELPSGPKGAARTLYLFRGSIEIEGVTYSGEKAFTLSGDVVITSAKGASLLFMQGSPINEPVSQHGPFVMNTRAEIQQAFEDYQRTRV